MKRLLHGKRNGVASSKHVDQVKANVTNLSHEVTGIKQEVDKVNSRVDTMQIDMNNMKEESEAIKRMARQPHTITGSSKSAVSSTKPTAFVRLARVLHVKGWAPFGSNDDRKLSRATAIALQKLIDMLVPPDIGEQVPLSEPVHAQPQHLHGGPPLAEQHREVVRRRVQRNTAQANKCEVKVAVDMAPMRREQVDIFYTGADEIKARNPLMRVTM